MADHLVGGLRCADVTDLAPSFVLGALEASEADALRLHLAGCPEVHAEVTELGSVVPALFESVELVEPPSSLRGRIMAAATAEQTAAEVAGQRADTQRNPVVPRSAAQPRRGPWPGLFARPAWAVAAIAAGFALVALGVWNVQLQDQISGLTAYRNGVVAVLEQAAEPGAQLAVLAPPESGAGPSGLAAVAADGSVALVMRDLAPTSGTQVYEAWVIAGTNAPEPIGSFRVGADGSAAFSTSNGSLGSGVTVALTLEPGPGATTPTMPIVVLGTAAAQST